METTWLSILTFMFVMYAILDGFDFGAGILALFIARDEKEGMLIRRSIGPFWDGNEVWLVAGGALMFMAFPTLYASFFSGFYLPLMLVLWLIMGRAISLELRNQIDHPMWKSFWDRLFGLSSLLLALIFGIAFGNILRGVNLGGVTDGTSVYEAHYFFAPFWTTFFPGEDVGVIDIFTLLVGLIATLTFALHGGNWVLLKIEDNYLSDRIKKANVILSVAVLALMVISFNLIPDIQPRIANRLTEKWPLLFIPLVSLVALIANTQFQKKDKTFAAFICSSLFIGGMFVTAIAGLFPSLLPSTNNINPDITIYSASTSEYGMNVAIVWWVLGIVLITGYTVMIHWIYRGKLAKGTETYTHFH
ncbi:MAG: cytochrome d ubiquinol oxidase subunit II [Cytophagales bacterium]|nr:cytochrome d ubiquinol oxidase subunit II [Cytophagales bacterium]